MLLSLIYSEIHRLPEHLLAELKESDPRENVRYLIFHIFLKSLRMIY